MLSQCYEHEIINTYIDSIIHKWEFPLKEIISAKLPELRHDVEISMGRRSKYYVFIDYINKKYSIIYQDYLYQLCGMDCVFYVYYYYPDKCNDSDACVGGDPRENRVARVFSEFTPLKIEPDMTRLKLLRTYRGRLSNE